MFRQFSWMNGLVYEESGQWPATLNMWESRPLELDDSGTHFGFVHSGDATIRCSSGEFTLQSGMYFSVPGSITIVGTGKGFVATRLSFRGFFQIGGPIESSGRLRYIDGCTDSVLISPVVLGDPCLNLLSIPTDTNQTSHTHPSLRAGLVVAGNGFCNTADGQVPLAPGSVFVIPADTEHSFHTVHSELLVVAWHPDSDTGPSHDDHPMLNRTIVQGTRAAEIGEIRT